MLSYYCFATFLNCKGAAVKWLDIFYMLFAKDSLQAGSLQMLTFGDGLNISSTWSVIFLSVPSIILFIISWFWKTNGLETSKNEAYLNLIPQLDKNERLHFLEIYFSNEHRDYIRNYLKINQNILVIRDYSAGSNATTMLCMNNEKNFFRKYAFGKDGEKLYQQIKWIDKFKELIPLPTILQYQREKELCYYDMAYYSSSVGLFEYAHSMPKEQVWTLVYKVIERLENSLYTVNIKKADTYAIKEYIESKVKNNLEKIASAKYLKKLMDYDEIIINGICFKNLPYFFLI